VKFQKDIMAEMSNRIENRVGLMITRGQIEHHGHAVLKQRMIRDNGFNIIGFGSCDKFRQPGNPLTAEEKLAAHEILWGDKFSHVFLQDLGATDHPDEWIDYVLSKIRSQHLPAPTDFYAGSKQEARWYTGHFSSLEGEPSYSSGGFEVWEDAVTGRRIHIADRTLGQAYSSSRVRALIEARDPDWQAEVDEKLFRFYEQVYPPGMRVPVEVHTAPQGCKSLLQALALQHPVGTRVVHTATGEMQILRDDGKFRTYDPVDETAKSLGD